MYFTGLWRLYAWFLVNCALYRGLSNISKYRARLVAPVVEWLAGSLSSMTSPTLALLYRHQKNKDFSLLKNLNTDSLAIFPYWSLSLKLFKPLSQTSKALKISKWAIKAVFWHYEIAGLETILKGKDVWLRK